MGIGRDGIKAVELRKIGLGHAVKPHHHGGSLFSGGCAFGIKGGGSFCCLSLDDAQVIGDAHPVESIRVLGGGQIPEGIVQGEGGKAAFGLGRNAQGTHQHHGHFFPGDGIIGAERIGAGAFRQSVGFGRGHRSGGIVILGHIGGLGSLGQIPAHQPPQHEHKVAAFEGEIGSVFIVPDALGDPLLPEKEDVLIGKAVRRHVGKGLSRGLKGGSKGKDKAKTKSQSQQTAWQRCK